MQPYDPPRAVQSPRPRTGRKRIIATAVFIVVTGTIAYLLPESFWSVVIPNVSVHRME
ncbi:MAG: hypothetical protein AAFU85_21205 [Planctomycetota bacterium]